MPLDISEIVDVQAQVYAGVSSRAEFGRGLFLTTDTTLDAGGNGKVGVYSSLRALQAVFPADSAPYRAGSAWFAQVPHPRALVVGRWAKTAVNTTITGGAPDTAANIEAADTLSIVLGGVAVDFSFDGDNSYTDQASEIQTKLRALATAAPNDQRFAGALATFENGAFKLEFPSHGDFGGPATGSGADTLGLSAAEGAQYAGGADAETVQEALAAIEAINDSWYWITVETAEANDTIVAVSNWVASRRKMFSAGNSQITAIAPNDAASFAAQASALQHARAPITWSRTADYAPVSIAARFSSVQFEQPNSLITAKFKPLPGIAPSELNTAQRDELVRKRVNYYARYGGTSLFAEGVTPAPGMWIDVQYFLDWLVNAIQTDVWNLLNSTPKVPQTEEGLAILQETIETPFEQGVSNGGIAPGTLSPAMAADIRQSTGNHDFDGFLTQGFLVHIGALSAQSQTQRESRVSPPITCWAKGAGAIHEANINIRFEQ